MPPKARISRQMILDASVALIREHGHESLNARSIAKSLKCSTQPVLYHFQSVDEIRKNAYRQIDQYHTSYLLPEENHENPLLAVGLNYVRFAAKEKKFFRFLFQTNQFGGMDLKTLVSHPALSQIILTLADRLSCDEKQAEEVFLGLFAAVHGLASLLANNALEYDETQITRVLTNLFAGLH